jgi:hypothetical protein
MNVNEIINELLIKETELIEKCHSLELENIKLKTENDDMNKFCEHLFSEIDFLKTTITKIPVPQTISNELVVPHPQIIIKNNEYNQLLNDYGENKKEEVLIELFDKFPNKYNYILDEIRDILPENINELAQKYNFEKDLELLLKSNKLINKNDKFEINTPDELVKKYVHGFNKNNKKTAYRYLKQALLFFPLTYKEQFLDKIQVFEDYDKKFEEIFNELYGENNDAKIQTINKFHIDYTKETIVNLINITKDKANPRQRALLVVEMLRKKSRPESDINQFKEGINEKLIKKI